MSIYNINKHYQELQSKTKNEPDNKEALPTPSKPNKHYQLP